MDKRTILDLPIQEVEWVDAASSSDVPLKDLLEFKSHTISRITMGRVLSYKEGVIVITDIQEDGKCEIWAIPKSFAPRIVK
jgi:hypothetical protein